MGLILLVLDMSERKKHDSCIFEVAILNFSCDYFYIIVDYLNRAALKAGKTGGWRERYVTFILLVHVWPRMPSYW